MIIECLSVELADAESRFLAEQLATSTVMYEDAQANLEDSFNLENDRILALKESLNSVQAHLSWRVIQDLTAADLESAANFNVALQLEQQWGAEFRKTRLDAEFARALQDDRSTSNKGVEEVLGATRVKEMMVCLFLYREGHVGG